MAQAKISTLSEFLAHSGVEYQVFDLGRRVRNIPAAEFEKIENAERPYPMPFQRTAIFGILFWYPEQTNHHYVWFLRFPLDEQGILLQVARDEFLVMVLDRVGASMLAAADGQKIEGALKDSPYTFTPREDKMAAFNARATATLGLPPSQYYATAQAYFTGQVPADNWQRLAMQGVADVAVRLEQSTEVSHLVNTLPGLPAVPLQTLAGFLEHVQIPMALAEKLAALLSAELQKSQPDPHRIVACLRAASDAPAQDLVRDMVTQTLNHDCSRDIEILAVIAGRCWTLLKQAELTSLYCEQLALNNAGQPGFSQLLADVLYLPDMREPVMRALRSPERSNALSQAVGAMFGQ